MFYGWRGWMKGEAAEGSDFGHQSQKECLEACRETRLFVNVAPLLAIRRIRNVVDVFCFRFARLAVLNVVSFEMPRHFGHARNDGCHSVPIAAEGHIDTEKDVGHIERVSSCERSF